MENFLWNGIFCMTSQMVGGVNEPRYRTWIKQSPRRAERVIFSWTGPDWRDATGLLPALLCSLFGSKMPHWRSNINRIFSTTFGVVSLGIWPLLPLATWHGGKDSGWLCNFTPVWYFHTGQSEGEQSCKWKWKTIMGKTQSTYAYLRTETGVFI